MKRSKPGGSPIGEVSTAKREGRGVRAPIVNAFDAETVTVARNGSKQETAIRRILTSDLIAELERQNRKAVADFLSQNAHAQDVVDAILQCVYYHGWQVHKGTVYCSRCGEIVAAERQALLDRAHPMQELVDRMAAQAREEAAEIARREKEKM